LFLNRLQGALLAKRFASSARAYLRRRPRSHCQGRPRIALVVLGPFETIELNAPGGIPDYCARYTGS